jgi:biotin operon repressor
MINSLMHLKDCIEKSIKQQGTSFAENFGKYGFWSNPFTGSEFPLSSNHETLFIDRNDEIKEISTEFVNSLLGRGDDTAIIGAEGVGTRSLINLFKHYAYSIETAEENTTNLKMKEKLLEIFDIKSNSINEDILIQLKEKIEVGIKNKKMILILSSFADNCELLNVKGEKDTEVRRMKRKLLELDNFSSDLTIFLSPWNATQYDFMKNEEISVMDNYEKTIFLKPLSTTQTVNLLKSRINTFENKSSDSINLFSEEALKYLSEYCGGLPKFALKFSEILLEEIINPEDGIYRSKPLTKEFIVGILENKKHKYKSYSKFFQSLKKLIPRHSWETKHGKIRTEMKIIKTAILLGKETTSTEIGKHLGKSRVAILENLKKLEKEGIIYYVNSSKDKRKRPFKINDFARSVFENEFIIPELERKLKSKKLNY